MDIVNVMNEMRIESKVVIERDTMTGVPRVKLIFRYLPDAEKLFATVNNSTFLGTKVSLTFKDPNMNYASTTSGAKTLVVRHIPLGVTSIDFFDIVRPFGRIISCKVLPDRSGVESYALLQFEIQDQAERCLREMNGYILRGSVVSLGWQFDKNSPYGNYPQHPRQSLGSVPNGGSSYQYSSSPTEYSTGTGAAQVAVGAGWSASSPPSPTSLNYHFAPATLTPPMSPPAVVYKPVHSGNWNKEAPIPTGWHRQPDTSSPTQSSSPSPTAPTANHLHQNQYQPELFTTSQTIASTIASSLASGLDPRNLYIKNLPPTYTDTDLFRLFKPHGRIISAKIMLDPVSGLSKGFGFVSFEVGEQALLAMRELNGKRVSVADAKEEEEGGVAVHVKPLVVCIAEPKGFRERKLAGIYNDSGLAHGGAGKKKKGRRGSGGSTTSSQGSSGTGVPGSVVDAAAAAAASAGVTSV
ncbi:hypothetical protein HDV05_007370 [Chytridiales sp. JEL 0842]|nr:hypothetical protein HDV05_007370 [Chytridiales sp. JEL 0842]